MKKTVEKFYKLAGGDAELSVFWSCSSFANRSTKSKIKLFRLSLVCFSLLSVCREFRTLIF